MLQISPVSFTSNERPKRISDERREDIRDTAMAGGAAGAGYTAAKGGGLNMAKKIKEASSSASQTTGSLKNGIKTIKETKAALEKPAVEAVGLFKKLKINASAYADRMLNSLKNMKAGKFVQRMMNTPVVKFGCGAVGGVLAVCVLLSGLGTLYNNTTKIVDNYAPKLADNFNEMAYRFKSTDEEEV